MKNLLSLSVLSACAWFTYGCGSLCGNTEQRTVTLSTDPSLHIERPGDITDVSLYGTITNTLPLDYFDPIFRAVDDGASNAQGIVISMGGRHPTTDEMIGLTLVLPTPLKANTTLTVESITQVPFGLPSEEGQGWALETAPSPGHARAAFATANYTFPPPTVTNTFVATEGSGTVRVLQRFGDGY
ncbi:MAG: hypothetical protein ABIS27_02740, partial [Longimicrobiales bacterium]